MQNSIPIQVLFFTLQTAALLWSIVLALSFLMGWRPYVVAAGGLASYPTGSLLFVAPADPLSFAAGAEAAFIAADEEKAENTEIAACFHIAAINAEENAFFIVKDVEDNRESVAPVSIPFGNWWAAPFSPCLFGKFGPELWRRAGENRRPALVASLLLLFSCRYGSAANRGEGKRQREPAVKVGERMCSRRSLPIQRKSAGPTKPGRFLFQQ